MKISKVGTNCKKNLARSENSGEGQVAERQPERRRELPPLRKYSL
jgi:hypothetical protein